MIHHRRLDRRTLARHGNAPHNSCEFDPCALPKEQRRALAAALVAQAFDLEYVERRYNVRLKPRHFDPDTLTVPEKRTVCNALAARGESVETLEATFGITRKGVQ
ncbi:hypothetical protein [Leifsonia sp. 22587]|uniref:hypothetical protein n=1 Tax=Leifsonia sp. 22587 TaxID=3453946 RepID=UPI003F860641